MSITHEAYLNIVPGDSPAPIIKVSQYDADFSIVFHLIAKKRGIVPAYPRTVENDEDVTINVPTSATVSVRGTKTDGNGYSANATLSGTATAPIVTVAGHEQMTASAGVNVYEITFYADNATKRLSTANFILFVEPAALDASTITSESLMLELNDLIAAVPNAVAAADRAEAAAAQFEIDATLTQQGKPADAKKVGDEISDIEDEISDIKEDLSELTPVTADIKQALYNMASHIALWSDEKGEQYVQALYDALYQDTGLIRIEAVFNQGTAKFYTITPLNDLKAYLTVTGYYSNGTSKHVSDYTLSGELTVGTSTITVNKDGKTDTFNVIVSAGEPWDYEWSYTDGMPENFGFTVESTGTPTVSMTNNGVSIITADTSNDVYRYKYTSLSETALYKEGVFEAEFEVTQYGTYNTAPYGNGVRVYAGLGLRGGDYVKCAELTFNKSGVLYQKDSTGWSVIDDTAIAVETLYKVRIEQTLTGATVYLNDTLIGTYNDLRENVSNPAFIVSRGAGALFKSFRFRLTE